MKRRNFLKETPLLAGAGLGMAMALSACNDEGTAGEVAHESVAPVSQPPKPIAVATWDVPVAVAKAGEWLDAGKKALDAAIEGAAIEEADVKNTTVGKGGAPDRDGHVTLDACVMDSDGNCGAVLCVENITHVAALARKVMEETPHVMLSGEGAEQFAYAMGFPKENLLTEASKKAWEEWKLKSEYQPVIN
ncbi:MAG: isoaspartyl peptidase/L-asparaginase, partial [Saprospiraceae bacterium]|nr:isoaspartyl peptidase/L-asparaginase [Saprospiraceae bacterium]